jgi:hypothetical protein
MLVFDDFFFFNVCRPEAFISNVWDDFGFPGKSTGRYTTHFVIYLICERHVASVRA